MVTKIHEWFSNPKLAAIAIREIPWGSLCKIPPHSVVVPPPLPPPPHPDHCTSPVNPSVAPLHPWPKFMLMFYYRIREGRGARGPQKPCYKIIASRGPCTLKGIHVSCIVDLFILLFLTLWLMRDWLLNHSYQDNYEHDLICEVLPSNIQVWIISTTSICCTTIPIMVLILCINNTQLVWQLKGALG